MLKGWVVVYMFVTHVNHCTKLVVIDERMTATEKKEETVYRLRGR